jgi:hypothetical protein
LRLKWLMVSPDRLLHETRWKWSKFPMGPIFLDVFAVILASSPTHISTQFEEFLEQQPREALRIVANHSMFFQK